MKKVIALLALAGLLVMTGAAFAQTPAQDQYGQEAPAAGQEKPTADKGGPDTESTEVEPGVFQPPVAGSTDDGLLPFTGAALILPAAIGAGMLGLGLFVVYRTRQRGES